MGFSRTVLQFSVRKAASPLCFLGVLLHSTIVRLFISGPVFEASGLGWILRAGGRGLFARLAGLSYAIFTDGEEDFIIDLEAANRELVLNGLGIVGA